MVRLLCGVCRPPCGFPPRARIFSFILLCDMDILEIRALSLWEKVCVPSLPACHKSPKCGPGTKLENELLKHAVWLFRFDRYPWLSLEKKSWTLTFSQKHSNSDIFVQNSVIFVQTGCLALSFSSPSLVAGRKKAGRRLISWVTAP